MGAMEYPWAQEKEVWLLILFLGKEPSGLLSPEPPHPSACLCTDIPALLALQSETRFLKCQAMLLTAAEAQPLGAS
jgi:hypothetical protein